MITLRVVNLRHEGCDLRICRPSRWGNPYRVGHDGTREEVIEKFRQWLYSSWVRLRFRNEIHRRNQKRANRDAPFTLGCWCAPEPCHGDAWIEALVKLWPDEFRSHLEIDRKDSNVVTTFDPDELELHTRKQGTRWRWDPIAMKWIYGKLM